MQFQATVDNGALIKGRSDTTVVEGLLLFIQINNNIAKSKSLIPTQKYEILIVDNIHITKRL